MSTVTQLVRLTLGIPRADSDVKIKPTVTGKLTGATSPLTRDAAAPL